MRKNLQAGFAGSFVFVFFLLERFILAGGRLVLTFPAFGGVTARVGRVGCRLASACHALCLHSSACLEVLACVHLCQRVGMSKYVCVFVCLCVCFGLLVQAMFLVVVL